VRQQLKAKPRLARGSVSPAQAEWRRALARAYLRTKKGAAEFTAGRLGNLEKELPLPHWALLEAPLSSCAAYAVRRAEENAQASADADKGALKHSVSDGDLAAGREGVTVQHARIGSASWVSPRRGGGGGGSGDGSGRVTPLRLSPGSSRRHGMDADAAYEELRHRINKRMRVKEQLMEVIEAALLEHQEDTKALWDLEDRLVKDILPEGEDAGRHELEPAQASHA
jgi:hypothetical protein